MAGTSSGSRAIGIDDQLVTAANPARTNLEGMDHARCAALHNYLVDYCTAAEGLSPAASNDTLVSTLGEAASAVLPRLHPSLVSFFAAARTPRSPFFFFAQSFPNPTTTDSCGGLFDNGLADLHSEPDDCLVRLYGPVIEAGGEDGGLIYHQRYHVAAFFMHIDDVDFAMPVDEHPLNWHPLETVLSNWISLIRLGKVVASPGETGMYGSEKVGPWEWRSYGDGQVDACVAAWDRLCSAIEARQDHPDDHDDVEPLLTPAALEAASIPDPSFAREFLGRARRPPRIRRIAPGLYLPPADGPSFAAAQPYAHLLRGSDDTHQLEEQQQPVLVPPVYILFSGPYDAPVDVTGWRSPFRGQLDVDSDEEASRLLPSRVPAGVYTEGVSRGRNLDCAEEGFHLLLPFAVMGARRSDGSEVVVRNGDYAGGGSVGGGLFQHGYKPFGGDYHRAQRLERLLDHWAGMVQRGVWDVGPRGVEGGLGVFRQVTDDYVIPPSW